MIISREPKQEDVALALVLEDDDDAELDDPESLGGIGDTTDPCAEEEEEEEDEDEPQKAWAMVTALALSLPSLVFFESVKRTSSPTCGTTGRASLEKWKKMSAPPVHAINPRSAQSVRMTPSCCDSILSHVS